MSEQEWLKAFADDLKYILYDFRMTGKELAEDAHISEATISKYLNAKSIPRLDAIINLSYTLGLDIDELINYNELIQ